MIRLFFTIFVLFLTVFSVSAEVRVRVNNDVPQIVVDGQPVRPRWFWGQPGNPTMKLHAGPNQLAFEVTGSIDEPKNVTMHLRFGQVSGKYRIDNIKVTDLETGEAMLPLCDFEKGEESFREHWTYWPSNEANTVAQVAVVPGVGESGSAALELTLREPVNKRWPDFHIYHQPRLGIRTGAKYKVEIWIDAEKPTTLSVGFYKPGTTFVTAAESPTIFEAQIKLAADAGIDFVSFPVNLPWPAPGNSDEGEFQIAIAACQRVLRTNPKALLVPRIGVYPPAWWVKANPGEMMQYESEGGKACFEVASEKWRKEASERLDLLIRRLEKEFGDKMAGYHPCGQNSAEWFYMDSWADRYHGFSPVAVAAFQQWLRKAYADDAALAKAWGKPVTFDTAQPPAPSVRREAAKAGMFLDPKTCRPVIDHNLFLQQAMIDGMLLMAKTVREASGGKKLSVFFYGYTFEFNALHRGAAASGHYGLARVLQSPDIDILCSPISYFDRQLGGSAPAMPAAESVMLHGKLWLYEDDTATHTTARHFPGSEHRAKNLWESRQLVLRNTAEETIRNFASWWMDLTAEGIFSDPGLWEEMKRLEPVDRELLKKPIPYRPGIAAVMDERTASYLAHASNRMTRPMLYESRAPLARSGAAFGQYLLDDLLAGRVDSPVVVLLNSWVLDDAQRQALKERTKGKVRLWCYAPGLYDPVAGDDVQRMTALTGFNFTQVTLPKALTVLPTEHGKNMGLTATGWTVDAEITPLFAATEVKPDEILATWPNGAAAVVMRQAADGGYDLFCGMPRLTPELIRLAAMLGKVHVFSEDNVVLYANGSLILLHGTKKGPVTIISPTSASVAFYDALSGEKLGDGTKLVLPLEFGETRLIQWRSADTGKP